MRIWILLLLLAVPLAAQERDLWENFEVRTLADEQYQPLSISRDRSGLGLRGRGGVGWDSNPYRVHNDVQSSSLVDGVVLAWGSARVGRALLGLRGHGAGRIYFNEPVANLWDVKAGGFIKAPYEGGFGIGLSGDALYQRRNEYEILGPVTRREDMRATGGIARAHAGWDFSLLTLEGGLSGSYVDYTEPAADDSLDNWTIGADAGVMIRIFDFARLRPYAELQHRRFLEYPDARADGTARDDELQLWQAAYGAEIDLHLGFLRAESRLYGRRQDDASSGFYRYWQVGGRGAIVFFLVGDARLTFGGDVWTREYDERSADDSKATLFERYGAVSAELGWNFWEFFSIGARAHHGRRTSGIRDGGYTVSEALAFLEIAF